MYVAPLRYRPRGVARESGQVVYKGEVETDRVGTSDNHSDLCTKATSGTTMHNLMFKLKGYEQIYISDELLQRLSAPDYFSGSKL